MNTNILNSNTATPEDFMVAKAQEEAGPTVSLSLENLDAGFSNRFLDRLTAEYDEEDGVYTIDEMLEAWDWTVKEWGADQ